MPPLARIGDSVFCVADTHIVPGAGPIPFPVTGQITDGAAKCPTYGASAARKGDKGVHAACPGLNTFEITGGSIKVKIFGAWAARMGDETTHCGSDPTGTTPNKGVIVGGCFTVFAG